MSEKIENGDTVVIKWEGMLPEPVIVINMPRGEGDLLQVEYANGLVQAFSPTRSDYVLEKRRKS